MVLTLIILTERALQWPFILGCLACQVVLFKFPGVYRPAELALKPWLRETRNLHCGGGLWGQYKLLIYGKSYGIRLMVT